MAGEYQLVVRRYAPFESFGGGFDGDNRTEASTNMSDTARTAGVVAFTFDGKASATGSSTGSSWVGPWAVRKSGRLGAIGHHIGQVSVALTNVQSSDTGVTFTVYTEGNLPLKDIMLHKSIAGGIDRLVRKVAPERRSFQGTPDIDTFLDFQASLSGRTLKVSGVMRGDGFPNAEIFMLDPGGKALLLLDYRTKSGVLGPLYRLFLSGDNNRVASFEAEVDVDAEGAFGAARMITPVLVRET